MATITVCNETLGRTCQDRPPSSPFSGPLGRSPLEWPQPIICFHQTLHSASFSSSSFLGLLLASSNLSILLPIYYPYPMSSYVLYGLKLCKVDLIKFLFQQSGLSMNCSETRKILLLFARPFRKCVLKQNIVQDWLFVMSPRALIPLLSQIGDNKPSQVILLPSNMASWLPRFVNFQTCVRQNQHSPRRP